MFHLDRTASFRLNIYLRSHLYFGKFSALNMDAYISSADNLARFRKYFPVASWVVCNVWLLLPIFAAPAIFAGFASIHYGLSLMCIWLGLVCFWVDRKHLNYCLFTPLQPLATILIMSLGAGISMVVHDSTEKFQYGLFVMQLIGLLGFPLFMGAYYLVTSKVPGFVFPGMVKVGVSPLVRPLILVAWFCLLHELARVVAGVASGTMDRGYAGDFQLDTPYGWWSIFSVFLRLQTLGYLLVPLIWRESRMPARLAAVAVVASILFLNLVAAARGAVFFPPFILMVGCYMFLEFNHVKYEVLVIIGVIALFPFVTIMSHYRNTEAFRETDIRNVFQKIGTMKDALARKAEVEESSGEHYSEAGRAYIGVADSIIYEMTPDLIPFEGFARLDDLKWMYVPYMFSSGSRPVLQDGYQIYVNYTGVQQERSTIGISWPADLYRRWGWLGIPVGLIIYGLFYGLFFRYIFSLYLNRNALLGFMISGIFFHSFISWIFTTVLSTAWYWLYDIPKHFMLIAVVYWVVKLLCSSDGVPGALALMGGSSSPAIFSTPNLPVIVAPRPLRAFRREPST